MKHILLIISLAFVANAQQQTYVNGAVVPPNLTCAGTNASSQLVAGTCSGGGGLVPQPDLTILGNDSGGTAIPEALNAQSVNAVLDTYLGDRSLAIINEILVNVKIKYGPTSLTAGDALRACLQDSTLPPGAICDMRSYDSALGSPLNGGHLPLEIGNNHTNSQKVWFANMGAMQMHTDAQYLATPAAPTVTGTNGGGNLAVGTYKVQLAIKTGDALSLPSPETTVTVPGTGSGFLTISPITCPTYGSSANVYITPVGGSSGTETLQKNIGCDAFGPGPGGSWIENAQLFPNTEAPPTAATPIPSVILHAGSEIFATGGVQSGFVFLMASGTAASNEAAFVNNGYQGVTNISFEVTTHVDGMNAVVYDGTGFFGAKRQYIFSSSFDSPYSYKISGQYNDIGFYDSSFLCGGGTGSSCKAALDIEWIPETVNDREGVNNITIHNGVVGVSTATGTVESMVRIAGADYSGTTVWKRLPSSVDTILFENTSFEGHTGAAITSAIHLINASSILCNACKVATAGARGGSVATLDSTYTIGTTGFPSTGDLTFFNSRLQGNVSSTAGFTNRIVNNITSTTVAMPVAPDPNFASVWWSGSFTVGGEQFSAMEYYGVPVKFDASSPVTVGTLTAGNCVQAGTNGLLTTTGAACGAGSGGGVTITTHALLPGTCPAAGLYLTTDDPVDQNIFTCSGASGAPAQLINIGGSGKIAVTSGSLDATSIVPATNQANAFTAVQALNAGSTGGNFSAAGTPVPTCNAGAKGVRIVAIDATATTYRSTYASGGANVTPLICDGANWLIY